ncbi:MAG: dockerin type I domain-containing protein [Christensenellaceae bacterium]|jgi:hypothetical protein|nr:dockerin type I domain-containing protein [Christensenellaceae bacterium]
MKRRISILAGLLCLTILGLGLLSTAGAIVLPNTGATIFPADASVAVKAFTDSFSNAANPLNLTEKSSGDYPFQYAAALDMAQVWTAFNMAKLLYTVTPNGTPWNEVLMAGYLNLTLTLDPLVTVDASEFSIAKVQAAYDAANNDGGAGTAFMAYWKVNSANYNSAAHTLAVQLQLFNLSGIAPAAPDNQWVLASSFDSGSVQPPMLYVATPSGALKVASGDFAVGGSFATVSALEGDFVFGILRNSAIHIAATISEGTVNMVAAPNLTIVDDYGDTADRILVIPRVGNTGEGGNMSWTRAIRLQTGGVDLTSAQIANVTWAVANIVGFEGKTAAITATNGSAVVNGQRSGIATLTATYNGATASIDVVVPGDVNRNGNVNSADASIIRDRFSGQTFAQIGVMVDQYTDFLADLNCNGNINSADSAIIRDMFSAALVPSN